jgi:uncharacterized protein Veg
MRFWGKIYNGKRVFNLEKNRTLASIKRDLEGHVGEKVTLRANGGRKKILVNNGVLEGVYPSIFVVRLESDTQRTVTYSYSDVLTKTVQLYFAG